MFEHWARYGSPRSVVTLVSLYQKMHEHKYIRVVIAQHAQYGDVPAYVTDCEAFCDHFAEQPFYDLWSYEVPF